MQVLSPIWLRIFVSTQNTVRMLRDQQTYFRSTGSRRVFNGQPRISVAQFSAPPPPCLSGCLFSPLPNFPLPFLPVAVFSVAVFSRCPIFHCRFFRCRFSANRLRHSKPTSFTVSHSTSPDCTTLSAQHFRSSGLQSNSLELATGQSPRPSAHQQQLQTITENEPLSLLPLSSHSAVEMLHDSVLYKSIIDIDIDTDIDIFAWPLCLTAFSPYIFTSIILIIFS